MSTRTIVEHLHVGGYRSLADIDIRDLSGVSVLIGANGAGKSNLVRFFEMVSWMLKSRRLEEFITRQGMLPGCCPTYCCSTSPSSDCIRRRSA